MDSRRNNRLPILAISAVIGALVGIGAGMVLVKRAEERGTSAITPREGLSVGLLVLGLLRQISQLGDGDES
jgi:hypothetical protein